MARGDDLTDASAGRTASRLMAIVRPRQFRAAVSGYDVPPEGSVDDGLVAVYTAQGEIDETQVRTFLKANGIPSISRGEALRKTHGFVLDGLGEVQIMVAAEHAEAAAELLAAVERGELNLAEEPLD